MKEKPMGVFIDKKFLVHLRSLLSIIYYFSNKAFIKNESELE